MTAFDIAWGLVKRAERTFVIESFSADGGDPYVDIELNAFLTANELDIDEDATQSEIEERLLDWMGDNVGGISGYVWYEITAEGKKRDWLNPKTDYDMV